MNNLMLYLDKLVGFQTVEGYDQQKQNCFDLAEKILTDAGLLITRQTHNGLPSLFASCQPTKRPKVILQAHLDVVPGKTDMFHLREVDGKLYGRGVYDMKFAAACYLHLAYELSEGLSQLDFAIMFTADEEIGGENGVGALIEQGFGAEVCLLPDGGDNWKIETTANGVWFLRLTATGKTAHGSRPWEGNNAIDQILSAVHEIKSVFGKSHPDNCSLTISEIEGGSAINQVPDHASLTLDMRFIDSEHYQRKRNQLESIVAKYKLNAETISEVDPCITDIDHPMIAAFLKTAEQTTGKKIGQTRSFGSSDARYFHQVNIPTILIRPNGGGPHSDKEWIDKEELHNFYKTIRAYITTHARVG